MEVEKRIKSKVKHNNHPMALQCLLRRHGYEKVKEYPKRTRVYKKQYRDDVWVMITTQHQKIIDFKHTNKDDILNLQQLFELRYLIKEENQIANKEIQ